MHRLALFLIWLEFAGCRPSEELCGCRDIKNGQLFNRSDADAYDLRFFVGVLTSTAGSDTTVCGGSLLNERFILTTGNFRCPLW